MDYRYVQPKTDWPLVRDAIMRLSSQLGGAFTYGELRQELELHDSLTIDGRAYAPVLDAVAQNLHSREPLWTSMVVKQDTRMPGDGLWRANPNDPRYADAGTLSEEGKAAWLEAQRAWCIAFAKVSESELDQTLRDREREAREIAELSLVDLLMEDRARERQEED